METVSETTLSIPIDTILLVIFFLGAGVILAVWDYKKSKLKAEKKKRG